MKKIIYMTSLILLSFSSLYAEGVISHVKEEVQKASIPNKSPKMKAKISRDMVKVKFMVFHDMLTKVQANYRNVKQNSLRSIVIQEDGQDLFIVKCTEYFAKNPIFKFKYKNNGGSLLTLKAEDEKGGIVSLSQKIKNATKSDIFPSVKIISDIDKNTTKIDVPLSVNAPVIKNYFKGITLFSTDKIILKTPEFSSNGNNLPASIITTLALKRVVIFASEEEGVLKFIGEIQMPTMRIQSLSWKIKLNAYSSFLVEKGMERMNPGIIVVVAEDSDGNYYIVQSTSEISYGGVEG